MAFLTEEQIQQFEKEYTRVRDELLTHKETEHISLYHRKLELANQMEHANRVFLHFAETGKVEIPD